MNQSKRGLFRRGCAMVLGLVLAMGWLMPTERFHGLPAHGAGDLAAV